MIREWKMAENTMTIEEFERHLLMYGPDLNTWPPALEAAAKKISETTEGAALIRDEVELITCWNADICPTGQADTAFTDRLLRIPEDHDQVSPVSLKEKVTALIDRYLSFTPTGFGAQAVSLMAVLLVGVAVGSQSADVVTSDAEPEAIDLSAYYFTEESIVEPDTFLSDFNDLIIQDDIS